MYVVIDQALTERVSGGMGSIPASLSVALKSPRMALEAPNYGQESISVAISARPYLAVVVICRTRHRGCAIYALTLAIFFGNTTTSPRPRSSSR
jgi:hypothetical protein